MESKNYYFSPDEVYVPSTGKISLPKDDRHNFRISGLIQKITIIDKQLAIAWAGDIDSAKNFLTAINDVNNIYKFNDDTFIKYIDNESDSIKNGAIGIIALIKHGTGWKMIYRNTEVIAGKLSTYCVDGSGGKFLAQQLDNFMSDRVVGGSNPQYYVMSVGASLTGTLITHEIHHHTSLKNLYGGAYEILTVDLNGVVKLDNILYVKWFAEYKNNRFVNFQLTHIFKYTYWKDILLVRSIKFNNDLISDNDSYTLIPTIFNELTNSDIKSCPIPNLDSELISHQITYFDSQNSAYTLSRNDINNPDIFSVNEKSLPGNKHQIEIRFKNSFFNDLSENLSNMIN